MQVSFKVVSRIHIGASNMNSNKMTPIVLEGNKIKACTSVKGVGVGRAEVPTCSKKERVYR